MLTYLGKLCLAKRITKFFSVFFYLNYLPKNQQDPLDWNILEKWALQSSVSVDMLLAKAFLILVISLVVRNNSCGNPLSSKFFLFILNILSVLFSATDFDLLKYCVFVSLILASW